MAEYNDIILCSPAYVKRATGLDDNLYDKYLLSAIRAAQDIKLRGVVGDALYDKLKALVNTGDIEQTAYADYKDLLDRSRVFVAYSAYVEVINRVNVKVVNKGVVKGTDTNLASAPAQEVENSRTYFQSLADSYCYDLQGYILENRAKWPELDENACRKVKANLYSSVTCGLWLGGKRGKICR